jgi:hypothetical protein
MLEIIILWRLIVRFGQLAAEKGLKKFPYQMMVVALWVCGELIAAFLTYGIFGENLAMWLRYGIALLGALAGFGIASLVMHLIPGQSNLPQASGSENGPETKNDKKFWRSAWPPVLSILVAISCFCLSLGASVFLLIRTTVQNTYAENGAIGTHLENGKVFPLPDATVYPRDKIIYFGFDCVTPSPEIEVSVNWYFDGELAYSDQRKIQKGYTIFHLDRKNLQVPAFEPGKYDVEVYHGPFLLVSSSFTVQSEADPNSGGKSMIPGPIRILGKLQTLSSGIPE